MWMRSRTTSCSRGEKEQVSRRKENDSWNDYESNATPRVRWRDLRVLVEESHDHNGNTSVITLTA